MNEPGQDALLRAQRLEAIGRMASGVAHDFNNLLTIISGYTELALSNPHTSEAVRRDLEDIQRAAERAAELTAQLLAFSRSTAVAPHPVDVNGVVLGLENMLRRLIGEDIELQVTARASPSTVRADPGQLEQVVVNLVVNARQAMPQGGTLRVETGAGDGSVVIAVRDTGVGMDRDTQTRIFEPFFTTTGGTGIGLSTVREIVEGAGGRIQVSSEVGCGTSFLIALPAVAQVVEQEASPELLMEMPRGTETILVVEGARHIRGFTGDVFRRLGYRVLEAANGAEGLELASRYDGPVDIVLVGTRCEEFIGPIMKVRPAARVLYVSTLHTPFTASSMASKVRELLDGKA